MTDTKKRYTQFRRLNTRGGRRRAIEAIALARSDRAAPFYVGRLWGSQRLFGVLFSESSNFYRWCYDISQAFRVVGYADEVSKEIIHLGWKTSDYPGEVTRGIVLQLPSKKGKLRYLAAMEFSVKPGSIKIDMQVTDCKATAAIWADDMARRYAEQEREYKAVWEAAKRFKETQSELKGLRLETLKLIKEKKMQSRFIGVCSEATSIVSEIRRKIKFNVVSIRQILEEQGEILYQFGSHSYWDEALACQ